MRSIAFTLFCAICCRTAAADRHAVPVKLEAVVWEDSAVWPLFDFLDVKVVRYRIVADEPVASITAKVTFRLRDSSGKLVESDHLDGGCMYTHGQKSALFTFLIGPEKAFVSVDGSSDKIATDFLKRVSGEYHYWKPSPDLDDRGNKIDMYAAYSQSKKTESSKTASIELEVSAETF